MGCWVSASFNPHTCPGLHDERSLWHLLSLPWVSFPAVGISWGGRDEKQRELPTCQVRMSAQPLTAQTRSPLGVLGQFSGYKAMDDSQMGSHMWGQQGSRNKGVRFMGREQSQEVDPGSVIWAEILCPAGCIKVAQHLSQSRPTK